VYQYPKQPMRKNKEIERVSSLFNKLSDRSKPFLDKCSRTKFLAVNDYASAADAYMKLVRETLSNKGLGLINQTDCQDCLLSVRNALDTYQLNSDLVNALQDLRLTYLESILKPAFKQYIQSDIYTRKDIENLYMNALKIDSLIDVIQFIKRIERIG
jgi:hypothetical protein